MRLELGQRPLAYLKLPFRVEGARVTLATLEIAAILVKVAAELLAALLLQHPGFLIVTTVVGTMLHVLATGALAGKRVLVIILVRPMVPRATPDLLAPHRLD